MTDDNSEYPPKPLTAKRLIEIRDALTDDAKRLEHAGDAMGYALAWQNKVISSSFGVDPRLISSGEPVSSTKSLIEEWKRQFPGQFQVKPIDLYQPAFTGNYFTAHVNHSPFVLRGGFGIHTRSQTIQLPDTATMREVLNAVLAHVRKVDNWQRVSIRQWPHPKGGINVHAEWYDQDEYHKPRCTVAIDNGECAMPFGEAPRTWTGLRLNVARIDGETVVPATATWDHPMIMRGPPRIGDKIVHPTKGWRMVVTKTERLYPGEETPSTSEVTCVRRRDETHLKEDDEARRESPLATPRP